MRPLCQERPHPRESAVPGSQQNDSPQPRQKQDDSPELLIRSTRQVEDWMATCPHAATICGYSLRLQASVVIAQTCKTWSCPICGRRRISRLAHRVRHAQPNRLCTLTIDPARHETPRAAFHTTSKALSVLVRDLRSAFGEWEHLRVLELTRKGWPHYHLMVRSPYVPHAWIRSRWAHLTGAHIVDIRQIKAQDKVYWYVVKYLAKQTRIDFTNRRVSQTRGFFKDPPFDPGPPLDLQDSIHRHQHPASYITRELSTRYLTRVSADCWILGRDPNAAREREPGDEDDA
jgi:hypothetical protein